MPAHRTAAPGPALIPILGDQLSLGLSSLITADKARDVVLMAEVMDEATYVRHNKKKIAFVFSAMRHFAEELRRQGWRVRYVRLDDEKNGGSFTSEVVRIAREIKASGIVVTEPGEWRVVQIIRDWERVTGIPVRILPDDRFICSTADFASWARGRRSLRMEFFYREMRRKTGLLMDGDEPEGGRWNFDTENRKPAKADLFIPRPLRFEPDRITREVLDLVATHFSDHFGDLEPFWFAVTQDDARKQLEYFLDTGLARFGDYQDAMLSSEPFLYHSILSITINAGLLDPLDVCRRVENAYRTGRAPLNAAEGFIRQIIGWREYVRGIYWLKMPEYFDLNSFGADRPLPEFYWTGETDMNCLRAAIGQTKSDAYAHHIQRLMVTGNFAMLAGIDPRQVHEWYLAVYADAYEWVELPNTLGMSQFADGGLLASKPYAASGNYINKMSDYCGSCRYDVKKRTGPNACPFNALYWDFLDRHADRLARNPRTAQIFATWRRFPEKEQAAVRSEARRILGELKPWGTKAG
jgi:deoxyribodipyrimidine photolyase-related protein